MRRYFYIILFVIVLILPFILRQFVSADRAPVASNSPAGKPSGRLVIVTPHNQDIRREFAAAFDAWHRKNYDQGVEIDYRTPGGTNDIKRLLETSYGALRDKDGKLPPEDQIRGIDLHMVWGGGDYPFDRELKPMGVLRKIELPDGLLKQAIPESRLGGIKLYDDALGPDGKLIGPQWIGVCLSTFGIVYNPDMYERLNLPAPARWNDLADPRLAGKIALADPTHSGSVAVAYMMVLQRAMADAEEAFFAKSPEIKALPKAEWAKNDAYRAAIAKGWHDGMGTLLLMAANARYFTDSGSQVPSDVGNGEAAAGIAIDFYARTYEEMFGSHRARYVAPVAATATTPDPVAILYGTRGESLTLAHHFIEFLLSPDGQRLWILKPGVPGGPVERSLRRPPIRRDVYGDRTGWVDDVNPFEASQGFNQRNEWMGLFTDIRTVWAAAWIDSRDALKESYETILAVKDDARRAQLVAELADVPLAMSDVEQLMADRVAKEKAKAPDVNEFKAKQRIDIANRFRAHYAAVAAKAEK